MLHAGFAQEILEYKDSAKNERSASGKILYDDGSFVVPLESSSLSPIRSVNLDLEDISSQDDVLRYIDEYTPASDLLNSVARVSSLQVIDRINISTLILALDDMIESMKGRLYGIILSRGDVRVNILHPFIAMMIASGEMDMSGYFSAVIYTYPSDNDISNERAKIYQKKIKDVLSIVAKEKTVPSLSLEPRRSLSEDIKNFMLDQNYSLSFRERASNSSRIAIPVHLASDTLTIPWYSLVYTERSGNGYLSKNIFPMLSGNVSSKYLESAGSTCTGNHDSSMFSSLYVLNNMNIGSMYFPNTVPKDSADFVYGCQKVSIDILKVYREALNG
jgi:hypothetical protein